jgi:hypothetical protein
MSKHTVNPDQSAECPGGNDGKEKPARRPRFFDKDVVWDNAQDYESQKANAQGGLFPAECAIFVVHGMGEQGWVETAAYLRQGFEDIIAQQNPPKQYAAPFIYEGYWANYENLVETFPANWQRFTSSGERRFFRSLWTTRPFSAKATVKWFLHQQWSLVWQCESFSPKLLVRGLYAALLLITIPIFFIALVIRSRFLNRYLCDVRLYCEPKGAIENAIVQRIHQRIVERFLELIGLDQDFKKLPRHKMLKVTGVPIPFKRVVWVSHSLGTVISYNVLSELLERADELANTGREEQKVGVQHFRDTLKCFVTMSCPLDKIAYLPTWEKIIQPWPQKCRDELYSLDKEWWINLYDLCDPISGALSNPFICHGQLPKNLYIKAGWLPFSTHNAYWHNENALRVILQKTFDNNEITNAAENIEEEEAVWRFLRLHIIWLLIIIFCIRIAQYIFGQQE